MRLIFKITIIFLILQIPLFASQTRNIKVALLDNLMSQKLSSEKYLEDYLAGIKAATILAKKYNLNIQYKSFFYDRNSLSILREIKNIKEWNPDVIIGPRSSDNFLMLKNYFSNTLVLSPMASSDEINNLPKNFHSLVLTDKYNEKAIQQFIHHQFPGQNIYAIIEADCKSCIGIGNLFTDEYKKANKRITIIKKYFLSDTTETLNLKEILLDYKPGDIFLIPNTSYSSGVIIARIVNYLKNPNLVFIGADGWGSWPVDYVGKVKTSAQYNAFRITSKFIDHSTNTYKTFQEIYTKNFHTDTPEDIIAFQSYKTLLSVIIATSTCPQNSSILNCYLIQLNKNKFWLHSTEYNVFELNTNGEKLFETLKLKL